MASVAPLGVAVVLWAVTSSPYVLLFAVLGPVMALGSFVDSRWNARRTIRRESVRVARETELALQSIESEHEAERGAARELCPTAASLIDRPDSARWLSSPSGPIPVALGTGEARSRLQVDGQSQELSQRAAVVRDSPVVVDARLGIGVVGTPVLARAAARSIAVGVARSLSPQAAWGVAAEPWAGELPHYRPGAPRAGFVAEFGSGSEVATAIAVAPSELELPGECRVVVQVDEAGAAIVRHPERDRRGPVRLGFLSADAARAWAIAAATDARRYGLVTPHADLPTVVALAALLRTEPSLSRTLDCEFSVDHDGAITLDLVRDGPHAVIGGTTGSGKSELLISWILAMAAASPPELVTFLLVDFKGGSAFAGLEALPHTVGIVTDLDETEAARALASLRAELRWRERALAEAGVRDISDTAVPRLVIVVDEFAAMLADHPDLHALFADIAARGRSLGIHLLLCTQRPSGVVRDAVLANADLRISLRVNNRADSSAVVGTDAAADLPAEARGRGILATAASGARRVQFALATPADVESIASRWPASRPPRRPWCAPLPSFITLAELPVPASGVPFGLADIPHEQLQRTAIWIPQQHGHVLVLGAARSGKSTALAALASERLPHDIPGAWDALVQLEGAADRVVAIDDLDALLAAFPQEHRDAVSERLARVLREGPARGVYLALAAQRVTADVQSLASLVPARLWLRHSSKQELLMAGGDSGDWLPHLPAGGGRWLGDRVQVAVGDAVVALRRSPVIAPSAPGPVAIVSTRAGVLAARAPHAITPAEIGGDMPGDALMIGDPEEWQSRWGALAALRASTQILFDGCSVIDFRALTRSRQLPPPLTGLADVAWRLEPDGSAVRVRLPI